MPTEPKPSAPPSSGEEIFSLDADDHAPAAPPPAAEGIFSLDDGAEPPPIVGEIVSLDEEPVMGEIVEPDSESIVMGEVVEFDGVEAAMKATAIAPALVDSPHPVKPPSGVVPQPEARPAFGSGSSAMMAALTDSKERSGKAKRRRPTRPAVKITHVLPGEKSPFAK